MLLIFGSAPSENLFNLLLLCVSENENLDSVREKQLQFETCEKVVINGICISEIEILLI